MAQTALRAVTAFATGGVSEYVRAGKSAVKGDVSGVVGGSLGAYGASAGGAAEKAAEKLVAKPGALTAPLAATPPPGEDQAAIKAAMDKADLERRKSASTAPNLTSALGLPGEARIKRSVLG